MTYSWLVLLPPVIILITALISQRLNFSIILGLICSTLIANHFAPIPALSLLSTRILQQAGDPENIYLYAFLGVLGILIALFEYTGAALAFAQRLTGHLKTAQSAQLATIAISSSLFIDDYLSCLTSGYVMRPIMDRFRIPRVKLAYLIHSFSGPIVILAPISSWIALITSQIEGAGLTTSMNHSAQDPLSLYMQSIPFILYSLLLIFTVLFIIYYSLSFGPMHTQEVIARKTGNLFGGKKPLDESLSSLGQKTGYISDLIIPLGILIVSFIAGVAWIGGYRFFGALSFLEALQKSNQTGLALLIASLITLAVTLTMTFAQKKCTPGIFVRSIVPVGIKMMLSSIIMVFLASTLGLMLRQDLHTGAYLAQTLYGSLSATMLPFLFFLISIITAIITGSAWGTIALMVPIAAQMVTGFGNASLLFPTLGALFSGAVCGNHVSPIAETTIMSSNSAGCYPIDHAITQFWYTLPAIIGTGIAFLVCGLTWHFGYWLSWSYSLGSGLLFCALYLGLVKYYARSK